MFGIAKLWNCMDDQAGFPEAITPQIHRRADEHFQTLDTGHPGFLFCEVVSISIRPHMEIRDPVVVQNAKQTSYRCVSVMHDPCAPIWCFCITIVLDYNRMDNVVRSFRRLLVLAPFSATRSCWRQDVGKSPPTWPERAIDEFRVPSRKAATERAICCAAHRGANSGLSLSVVSVTLSIGGNCVESDKGYGDVRPWRQTTPDGHIPEPRLSP